MKKLPLFVATLLLTATVTSCSGTSPRQNADAPQTSGVTTTENTTVSDAIQVVDDASQVEDVIGKDISVSADDSSYAVIAKSIGQVTFTRKKVSYSLRASEYLVGDAMAGINSAMKTETTEETIDDVTVTFGSFEDGTLIAFWTIDKLNYSLTCQDGNEDKLKATVSYVIKE